MNRSFLVRSILGNIKSPTVAIQRALAIEGLLEEAVRDISDPDLGRLGKLWTQHIDLIGIA